MFYPLGKPQKNLIGGGQPRPRALFPGFGGGGQETRPGDEVGGWQPGSSFPSPALYVQGLNGFNFYFDLF